MQEQLKLTGCYSLFQRHVTLWIDERMVRFEQGMWKAIKVAEVCSHGVMYVNSEVEHNVFM